MLEAILYILVLLVAFFCFTVSLMIGLSAIAILFTKVPFVPTPNKNVKTIIDLFELKPGQIFYDLGCGDGRFLIEAEKRGANAIGFEISPWAFIQGKINLIRHQSKARILYRNFYQQDITDASAVFCFLMDSIMPKVEAKLKKELGIGAKVICYGFKLPNWQPEKVIDFVPGEEKSSNIYLYVKKSK